MRFKVLLATMSMMGVAAPATDANAAPPAKPPTDPTQVAASELGIDGSTATVPWRAELNSDGTMRVVFGPGTSAVATGPTAVKVAASDAAALEPAASPSAAALSWYCNVYTTYSTDLTGGNNLRTYYEVDCYNVSYHRVDWQFQRSSWSGYRSYTNWTTGGNVSGITNATYINAYCSGGGGTYDYRGNIKSVVTVGGSSYTSPSQATAKGRYTCGTGVS
jgi:hypothetical protein